MRRDVSRIDNALIGAAGVHFVVSELSLRGLIALPTTRNTVGIDVVVVSLDGSLHANLQVKASKIRSLFGRSEKVMRKSAAGTISTFSQGISKRNHALRRFSSRRIKLQKQLKPDANSLGVLAMQSGLPAGSCQRMKRAANESVGSGLSLAEGD